MGKTNLDNVPFDPEIDYYFFTELDNVTSTKWNVVKTNLQEKLEYMNGFRHTSKHCKFVLPDILKKYDIIMRVDCKVICRKSLKITKSDIIKLFEQNQNASIFFIKHANRKTAHQELEITIKCGLEHKNGENFLKEIKDIKFQTHMPDTNCFFYKNNTQNNNMLECVYDTLINKGLRRDQNVIQFVLFQNNYESNIDYFKM
jgi:hypothetical protein